MATCRRAAIHQYGFSKGKITDHGSTELAEVDDIT